MQLVGPFPNHQTHAPWQNAPLNWEHLEWYWLIPRGTVGKFLFDLFLFLFFNIVFFILSRIKNNNTGKKRLRFSVTLALFFYVILEKKRMI